MQQPTLVQHLCNIGSKEHPSLVRVSRSQWHPALPQCERSHVTGGMALSMTCTTLPVGGGMASADATRDPGGRTDQYVSSSSAHRSHTYRVYIAMSPWMSLVGALVGRGAYDNGKQPSGDVVW